MTGQEKGHTPAPQHRELYRGSQIEKNLNRFIYQDKQGNNSQATDAKTNRKTNNQSGQARTQLPRNMEGSGHEQHDRHGNTGSKETM